MAAIHNDGTVQYGSVELTIPTAGVAYIANRCEVTRPTKKIMRVDELGEPDGFVLVADFVTGSATLQLASGSTVYPQLGDVFTHTFDSETGSESWVVSSTGQPLEAEGQKFITINFDKKYN